MGCQSPKVEPVARAVDCACPAVAVEGVITNVGENYFSGAKFVVKDESGEMEVRPWLPLEVAPYHPDVAEEMQKRGDRWPPETMASYLGIPVRLYGKVENKILTVTHAEKLK